MKKLLLATMVASLLGSGSVIAKEGETSPGKATEEAKAKLVGCLNDHIAPKGGLPGSEQKVMAWRGAHCENNEEGIKVHFDSKKDAWVVVVDDTSNSASCIVGKLPLVNSKTGAPILQEGGNPYMTNQVICE